MRLFWTKTYEGTSLTDLTEAMGISPPSLYAAFGSKEALFREAVAHYEQHQGVEMWRVLEETAGMREAIEGFLLATAEAFTRPGDPPGCLIILGTQHALDETDPAHHELRARRKMNQDQLAQRFSRAVAVGDLGESFPVDEATAFYFSVQTGMSVLARDGADRSTLDAIALGAMLGWENWSKPRADRAGRTKPAPRASTT